ncbi:hypothetical protein SFRURICE_006153 [Spodoptera frugiperda]|uniref:SFRICE_031846 n=1 Tax=Spodoptera frugiperda TaxID=7108 RepID=A0A2H1VRZ6_SPOFR|nr:hypothetical protein SFRURICE_006153 [Spodoptera frugiperda]
MLKMWLFLVFLALLSLTNIPTDAGIIESSFDPSWSYLHSRGRECAFGLHYVHQRCLNMREFMEYMYNDYAYY